MLEMREVRLNVSPCHHMSSQCFTDQHQLHESLFEYSECVPVLMAQEEACRYCTIFVQCQVFGKSGSLKEVDYVPKIEEAQCRCEGSEEHSGII